MCEGAGAEVADGLNALVESDLAKCDSACLFTRRSGLTNCRALRQTEKDC